MRLFFMALGLLFVSSGTAFADPARDCNPEKDQALAIPSCTRIIEGRAKGKKEFAYTVRCYAHSQKGDYDRAMADCNEAIRLKPDNAAASITAVSSIERKATMTAPSWIATKPSASSLTMR